MRKEKEILKNYSNQILMNDFNNMMIRVKAHLFEFNDLKTSALISPNDFPKPSVQELDDLTYRVLAILKKDNKPLIK